MSSNTTNQSKPSSYINIAADVNFLQRIICCNHDISNTPADTPKGISTGTPKATTPKGTQGKPYAPDTTPTDSENMR